MIDHELRLRNEIGRTTGEIELWHLRFTRDGQYVRLSDGNAMWWQPAAPLLAILSSLPDRHYGHAESIRADEYSRWCLATAAAGIFNGHNIPTTMAAPADFIAPE